MQQQGTTFKTLKDNLQPKFPPQFTNIATAGNNGQDQAVYNCQGAPAGEGVDGCQVMVAGTGMQGQQKVRN